MKMSAVQPNAKVIGASILIGVIVLSALYSTWHSSKNHLDELKAHFMLGHSHHDHDHGAKSINSWKTKVFEDIPSEPLEKSKAIKIIERHTEVELQGQKLQIFSRQTSVTGEGKKFTVLLLHGMKFSSKNWQEIKTIQLVAAMGYRVVAIDLPGFGASGDEKLKDEDKATFLKLFIEKEKLGKPLIVSPSMSGSFALPYLLENDPETCGERATAYIPVAPAGSDDYSDADYKQCQIPVMIVYGEHDTQLGVSSRKHLQQFDVSEVFVIKKAGHACYLDDSKEWSRLLYNFINAVERYLD